MSEQQTPGTPGDEAQAPGAWLAAAATEHEHLMATHFQVIEGWLGLLEDDLLDPAARRRAASVLLARNITMRADVMAFLQDLKGHTDG